MQFTLVGAKVVRKVAGRQFPFRCDFCADFVLHFASESQQCGENSLQTLLLPYPPADEGVCS